MGLFKSLGQVLGGVAALVGQKAFLDSQSCGISLTEAATPSRLFTTALHCTAKEPSVIATYISIIPSHDEFNTSSHLNSSTAIRAESFVFDYPLDSSNATTSPLTGYLSLLPSATEVGWAIFEEFYLAPAAHALLMTVILPLFLRIWRIIDPKIVYREGVLPLLLFARRSAIVIWICLVQFYCCCAVVIKFLLAIFLALWRLITTPKANEYHPPGASVVPTPTPTDKELTYLHDIIQSQATEIQQFKAGVTAAKADKQNDIDKAVDARAKILERKTKSWKDALAKEKRDAGDSMERQKEYHDEELTEMKERYEEESKVAAEKHETVLADMRQRIDALQAQVNEHQTQSGLNPQGKPHEAVSLEGDEARRLDEIVAEAVQKKNHEWETLIDTERTKVEETVKILQEQLTNATESSISETTRANHAQSLFDDAQQTNSQWQTQAQDLTRQLQDSQGSASQWHGQAQDLTRQLQDSQDSASQWQDQAQNLSTQLQNSQNIANRWAQQEQDLQTQLQDAQQTLTAVTSRAQGLVAQLQNSQEAVAEQGERATDAESKLKELQDGEREQRSRATDAETKFRQAQDEEKAQRLRAEIAERRLALSQQDVASLKKQAENMGSPSTARLFSAGPFTPTWPTADGGNSTGIPRVPATTPLYNATSLPIFGGRAVGTTQVIPGTSGTPPQSLAGLAGYLKDKHNLHGPTNTPAPVTPGLSLPATSITPSSLPGPSNSSPPYIPGLSGPVATPTNTTPGKGPITNPFNPSAKPFDPEAPLDLPLVGWPYDDAVSDSSSSLSSPPPSDDEGEVEEDALSDNGLNDLSEFPDPYDNAWDPNDTAWDAIDGNKAPADVMAGRKMAKPRGRRGRASAGRHEDDAIARRRSAERLVARVARLEKKAREDGRPWALAGIDNDTENAGVSYGGDGAESAAVEGGGNADEVEGGGDVLMSGGGNADEVKGRGDVLMSGGAMGGNEGSSGGVGVGVSDEELLGELDGEEL